MLFQKRYINRTKLVFKQKSGNEKFLCCTS